jgi:Family of unknown function (DUF5519)
MLSGQERECFALEVMEEVRRWPGVQMRPHLGPDDADEPDGVEFRLSGRQIGHMHSDCAVHLSLTRALKASLLLERLAEQAMFAPESGWATFTPIIAEDAQRAIWLLRLNYVRLRRQRLTPAAAASSALLREHEAALRPISAAVANVLQRTRARARPRPLPSLELPSLDLPSVELPSLQLPSTEPPTLEA